MPDVDSQRVHASDDVGDDDLLLIPDRLGHLGDDLRTKANGCGANVGGVLDAIGLLAVPHWTVERRNGGRKNRGKSRSGKTGGRRALNREKDVGKRRTGEGIRIEGDRILLEQLAAQELVEEGAPLLRIAGQASLRGEGAGKVEDVETAIGALVAFNIT